MKNLLRRLHLAGNNEDQSDGSHGKTSKSRFSLSDVMPASSAPSESKSSHGLSGFLSAAKQTLHQAGSLKPKKEGPSFSEKELRAKNEDSYVGSDHAQLASSPSAGCACGSERIETPEATGKTGDSEDRLSLNPATLPSPLAALTSDTEHKSLTCSSSESTILAVDALLRATPGIQRTQTSELDALRLATDQAVLLQDEELQVRVAMALSVRDDPEAATIENIKDATRGSDPRLSDSKAQLLAYRYWKYGIVGYEEKIVDGFYDAYSVAPTVSVEILPSLTELRRNSISNQSIWEAVLVDRSADKELEMLEQKAISLVSSSGSVLSGDSNVHVINIIAEMVVNQMGGPVEDEKIFLRTWNSSIATLRSNVGSVVLPLGKLNVGLGRHRALLFKVLADAIGIPCQVVKGRQYILNDEAVVIVIKDDLGREFIVDLIAVPGLLIPYDASLFSSTVPKSREAENVAIDDVARSVQEASVPQVVKKLLKESHATPMQWPKRSVVHRRSPSWTEGVGLAGSRDLNVNDVSQYLINAAKDNALRAQKLDEVPIASSVEAPPDSFLENSQKELQMRYDEWKSVNENQKIIRSRGDAIRRRQQSSVGPGRPPLLIESQSPISDEGREKLHRLNSVEGLGDRHPLDFGIASVSQSSSPNSSASSAAATTQSTSPVLPAVTNPTLVHEGLPPELIKGPVAAAAATAAVVASSMLVAATKSEHAVDPAMDVPVAVAATATAAVVAATTAVVGRRVELTVPETVKEEPAEKDVHGVEQKYVDDNSRQQFSENLVPEGAGSGGAERVSDKSTGSLSSKSDRVLDDVAEFEISWEDLNIGERIGLGSYGEVYRGDWHGTEVAVKKFLDQDISGDALLEFASEVRLMKRMRHPNVVLFMGAVMHPPNLSIVTEFLPRGSLYRLIHRSSNQIDERRRMRMALDVAKGMNYLHNCTPIIVHRDLKSPNLLVDKNWVVKVCDFGLSRMKHSTFLSTKSTAGTPEWMAPEVLRNEPSNEKSDVYSFGVVLWELVTLQQPWANMNPMQVVGAVGFQHRNLDIPEDVDPVIVRIIRQCWQSDPGLRPSFAEIINILKPLQKPITASQVSKS